MLYRQKMSPTHAATVEPPEAGALLHLALQASELLKSPAGSWAHVLVVRWQINLGGEHLAAHAAELLKSPVGSWTH